MSEKNGVNDTNGVSETKEQKIIHSFLVEALKEYVNLVNKTFGITDAEECLRKKKSKMVITARKSRFGNWVISEDGKFLVIDKVTKKVLGREDEHGNII